MLGVTWVVWDHEQQVARRELRSQFDYSLRDTVSRIDQRVSSYEQMLRGVQALFATTSLTNRRAVRDYVEALRLDANFAGIRIIGVSEWVPASRQSAHIATMRRFGFADYKIHPDKGGHEGYAPIIQREPYIEGNRAALGFDPWSEPVRRLAMERARDSGMAAISGKVRLAVDNDAEAQPGFVMYLPIYAHDRPQDSVVQRRNNLVGWVYAAFHVSDFMASLYGNPLPGLSISIYDDVAATEATLMYRAGEIPDKRLSLAQNVLHANEYMVVAGHTWTLSLTAQDEFEDRFGRNAGYEIAGTGVGLSLSMALLAWLLATGRARAIQLAGKMTEELRQMTQHDQLTGLPNRALFSDRLHQALTHAKRYKGQFAVIFLDLDNFKPINDNFGHAVGDLLLQLVAKRLLESVRASDTVGRIGGDEFVVLLPELTESGAALGLAEKIRCAVRLPFVIEGQELNISCSLGVAIFPTDGCDEISLTKSADEAMYRAKGAGRDSVQLAN